MTFEAQSQGANMVQFFCGAQRKDGGLAKSVVPGFHPALSLGSSVTLDKWLQISVSPLVSSPTYRVVRF